MFMIPIPPTKRDTAAALAKSIVKMAEVLASYFPP